jgi:hypothetical protein
MWCHGRHWIRQISWHLVMPIASAWKYFRLHQLRLPNIVSGRDRVMVKAMEAVRATKAEGQQELKWAGRKPVHWAG